MNYCGELHKLFHKLERHTFPFNESKIPLNGIYILFEINESGHGADRIVRVGSHTGKDQLPSRLKEHFINENKDRSIFRKNIGRALLNKEKDPFLDLWEHDLTSSENKKKYANKINVDKKSAVESEVSQVIQENFSFVVIPLKSKKDRLKLESRIISTVSCCSECTSSLTWLGLHSTKSKIRKSGLWQEQGLYKEALSQEELQHLINSFDGKTSQMKSIHIKLEAQQQEQSASSKNDNLINILIKRGLELMNQPFETQEFTGDRDADRLLNDIQHYPHAFVLACIMDRQIKAERAWLIPYRISQEINGFEFTKLLSLTMKQIKIIFRQKKLHRFNEDMAEYFYNGIHKIHTEYNNNAAMIWINNPRSAAVVRRFLGFQGIGVKISTMATNILARDFKVPMKDHICIDISPDVHVKRVFKRLGFLSGDAGNDELLYRAREFNPEYPGIFDLSCWEIGRNWCSTKNPTCDLCYLKRYCPKII